MKKLNNTGSHVVALVVGVLVVGVVGFAGYTVWQRNNDTSTTASVGTKTAASAAPASIKTNADLTAAAKTLDASSSNVDSSLNDNGLNADLNDML